MPLKFVNPLQSAAARKAAKKSPWRYGIPRIGAGSDRFGATTYDRLLCQECYDQRRRSQTITRVVQRPGEELRCEDCGETYADATGSVIGRKSRRKR